MAVKEHAKIREPAELIALCQRCRYKDCIGICDDYREAATALFGGRRRKDCPPAPKVIVHEGNPPRYTIEGVTLTRPQWAARYGINDQTLYKRMNRMTLAEALQMGPAREYYAKGGAKLHRAFGRAYSVKEWSRRTGVSQSRLYVILEHGGNIEEYCMNRGIAPDLEER